MRFVFLIFILIPIIEITLLIQVGGQLGALATIGLVFASAIIGVSLIRRQGTSSIFKAKEKVKQGTLPAKEIVDTLMLGLAGILLFLPGFVTDTIGLLLVVPLFRKIIISVALVKFIKSRVNMNGSWNKSSFTNKNDEGEIIEGEFTNEDRDLINRK